MAISVVAYFTLACTGGYYEDKDADEFDTAGSCCSDPSTCYDGTTFATLPAGYVLLADGSWACDSSAAPVQAPFQVDIGTFPAAHVTDNGTEYADMQSEVLARFTEVVAYWLPVTRATPLTFGPIDRDTTASTSKKYPVAGDGLNEVYFYEGYMPDGTQDALMYTSCAFAGSDSADQNSCCQYKDCDIWVYSEYYSSRTGDFVQIEWSTSYYPESVYDSLPFVLLHELGHLLALGHQDPATFPASVMVGDGGTTGETFRSPDDASDLEAVRYIYGPK